MNVNKIGEITCCNYDDKDRYLLTLQINSEAKYLDNLIRKKGIRSSLWSNKIDTEFGLRKVSGKYNLIIY